MINDKLSFVKTLNKNLNKFKYGTVVNNKAETNLNKIDFSKYKTLPINTFKKFQIGVCWDYVNYQHYMFKQAKINDESYFFVLAKTPGDNNIITHTFSIVNIENSKYWVESSLHSKQGVHEIKSYKEVVDCLVKKYETDTSEWEVYKYNPDGMDQNLTNSDFFKSATNQMVMHS